MFASKIKYQLVTVRNFKEVIVDMVKKPPMLFPLVGLFHVLWLVYTVWTFRDVPFPGITWLEVVWLLAYTTFWLAACDLRKWGAIGYIALAVINTSIYFLQGKPAHTTDYLSNLFELDVLFSFGLLYYFKKFR